MSMVLKASSKRPISKYLYSISPYLYLVSVRESEVWGEEFEQHRQEERKQSNHLPVLALLSPLLCSSNYWLLSLPSVCSRAAPLLHSPQAIEYVTSAMGLGAQGHCAP